MKKPISKNGNVLHGEFIPKTKSDDLHSIIDILWADAIQADKVRQQKYQEEILQINENLFEAKREFVKAELKYNRRIKLINNIRTTGYIIGLGALVIGTIISLTK